MNTILRRISSLRCQLAPSSRAIIKPRSRLRFSSERTSQERVDRINSRLPRFLHRYTARLKSAPLTHITAFLLLHEITAVVPLLGLASAFHYFHWLPPYISEWKYASDGIEKFGAYFRRKGWLGSDGDAKRARAWGWGEGGVRVVVELATAYAITKVLLPLRLVLSVAATPWFARVAVMPPLRLVKRVFGRGGGGGAGSAGNSGLAASPAGGTNAVGGGVTTGKL